MGVKMVCPETSEIEKSVQRRHTAKFVRAQSPKHPMTVSIFRPQSKRFWTAKNNVKRYTSKSCGNSTVRFFWFYRLPEAKNRRRK
jgi:hypothetical protein